MSSRPACPARTSPAPTTWPRWSTRPTRTRSFASCPPRARHEVDVGNRQLQFRNTNGLVRNPEWEIGLQKTGYISEAGRCLVMQAQLAGRKLIMVLLDSAGKYSRIGDAERMRKWLDHAGAVRRRRKRADRPAF